MRFPFKTLGLLVASLALTTWVGTTGRDAAPWWAFAVLVGAYVVLAALWTVRLLRAYRPPVQTG